MSAKVRGEDSERLGEAPERVGSAGKQTTAPLPFHITRPPVEEEHWFTLAFFDNRKVSPFCGNRNAAHGGMVPNRVPNKRLSKKGGLQFRIRLPYHRFSIGRKRVMSSNHFGSTLAAEADEISQSIKPRGKQFTDEAEAFVQTLDRRVAEMMSSVENSELYQLIANPSTDPKFVAAMVKYVLLEVFSYGPHVTEATFTAIGRFPKDRPDLMKPLILHDLSEVDHGELALKDYLKLGGSEEEARSRRMTPSSFNMAATCRRIGEAESPFAFLGYMYPFETLTPLLTERAKAFLQMHGFPMEARVFIDTHAEEDIGHANLLALMVKRVVEDYPEAKGDILFGFDCFERVYPLPIWEDALIHAKAELGL